MTMEPPSSPQPPSSAPASSTPCGFRFKSKRSRSVSPSNSQSHAHPSSSHHRHHNHHHRSHRRRRRTPSPASPPLSPDVAFRESLFDALADDEGAAFWEGVYGQPIHTYSPYASRSGGGGGELERMDDEEYVAYVRGKMWEKSHEFVIEERRRREEQRKRKRRVEEEGRIWERGLEEALRRGEDRRRRLKWKQRWEEYTLSWEGSKKLLEGRKTRDLIVWPVESGKWEDVEKEEVERFFRNAPQPKMGEPEADLRAVLKVERVRWHPDKVQQRFGSQRIDDETRKMVTAVFQFIDMMWLAARGN